MQTQKKIKVKFRQDFRRFDISLLNTIFVSVVEGRNALEAVLNLVDEHFHLQVRDP